MRLLIASVKTSPWVCDDIVWCVVLVERLGWWGMCRGASVGRLYKVDEGVERLRFEVDLVLGRGERGGWKQGRYETSSCYESGMKWGHCVIGDFKSRYMDSEKQETESWREK
jgi:hypothetical protein